MIKYLTTHGNSLALVIEKGILELLGIDRKTPLKISTDGSCLIISPVHDTKRQKKIETSLIKISDRHAKAFKKLASRADT